MKKIIDKIKSVFSLSMLLKVIIIALIVITRLFPALFDPEHANWKKVIFNFIFALIIFMGSFISQLLAARKRETEKESYTTARADHIGQIRTIQKRSLSHMHKMYVQDENDKNKLQYVRDVFAQYEIDIRLYTEDLSLVKLALKKGEIDKEQYSVIQLCRKGKIEYDKYEVGDLMSTQILKKGSNRNKSQQGVITASNLLSKMSFMLAFSILIGMFVWDKELQEEGIKNGQAWLDLGSNLITFAGGLWTGTETAREVAEDDIRLFNVYFNFNCKFVQDFDNGIWKPKESEISDDLIERLKKYQSEEQTTPDEAENEQDEDIGVIEISEEELEALKNKGML